MLLKEIKKLDADYRWTANGSGLSRSAAKTSTSPRSMRFQKFKNKRMNAEIKQSEPSIIAPLCTLIAKHNVSDKVLVASFSHRDLETFRARCPNVAASASPQELVKFSLGKQLPFQ